MALFDLRADMNMELIGKLIAINSDVEVEIIRMELDAVSRRRLFNAASSGIITSDNQDLVVLNLEINKKDYGEFTRGQNSFEKQGNRYVMVPSASHAVRFSGILQTVTGLNKYSNYLYGIEIGIGAIEFEVFNSKVTFNGDIAEFQNIKATLYSRTGFSLKVAQ